MKEDAGRLPSILQRLLLHLPFLFLLLLLVVPPAVHAVAVLSSQSRQTRLAPTHPSLFFGMDSLNRTLPSFPLTPISTPNRTVGIFYFLWHQSKLPGPFDNSLLLVAAGGDRRKVQYGPVGAFHHWGQPAFGYYLSEDPWVIRKHASLLADAMVDFVCFDVTNALTYDSTWQKILDVYADMRSKGSRTPQVTFILWNNVPALVQHLYDVLYQPRLHSDLWFQWLGKPLLLANTSGVDPALLSFFTFRESWAWTSGTWFGDGHDRWPWIDWYPQGAGWHSDPAHLEQMPVAVGGWPTSNVGRSCQSTPLTEPPPALQAPSIGHYFRMQFQHALNSLCSDLSYHCTPPAPKTRVLFITGFNEWIAQRFIQGKGPCVPFLNQSCLPGDSYFVDEYTQEFSRDIEPMHGGHTDNYYLQLTAFVRYYKGTERPVPSTPPQHMIIDCQFTDWSTIQPMYQDDTGDAISRHYPAWGMDGMMYTDDSTREDLCTSRITSDPFTLFVYLSSCTEQWQYNAQFTHVYIGGVNMTGGWYGFMYWIDIEQRIVYRHAGQWNESSWTKVSQLDVCVSQMTGELELAIPLNVLGIKMPTEIYVKFWDGTIAGRQGRGVEDVMDFLKFGDAAPNSRFAYRYIQQQRGDAVNSRKR